MRTASILFPALRSFSPHPLRALPGSSRLVRFIPCLQEIRSTYFLFGRGACSRTGFSQWDPRFAEFESGRPWQSLKTGASEGSANLHAPRVLAARGPYHIHRAVAPGRTRRPRPRTHASHRA